MSSIKLAQAKSIVEAAVEFNIKNEGSNSSYITPMLWSLPGEGKTTMVETVAEEKGLPLVTVVAAQFDAGEMGGFPLVDKENDTYYRARPFFMPTEGKGIIFLDELPQAPTANQNIVAQLVNERRIGEHRLPKGWTIVAAGNPLGAKAGTNPMPSHLKDRLMHINIETDVDGFREFALSKGFKPEVTSFLFERPEWLQKFDPKADASPSPRSWERVNTILGLGLGKTEETHAIQGMVGEGAVADFVGYLRIWRDLPKFEDIVKDPETFAIPENPAVMYALCSSIAHKANKTNVKNVITYIKRFENKEFSAFCMKDTLQRNPELKTEKVVTQWFLTEGKELML